MFKSIWCGRYIDKDARGIHSVPYAADEGGGTTVIEFNKYGLTIAKELKRPDLHTTPIRMWICGNFPEIKG